MCKEILSSKQGIITWSSAGGADGKTGSGIGGADGILGLDGCNGCMVSNKQDEAFISEAEKTCEMSHKKTINKSSVKRHEDIFT